MDKDLALKNLIQITNCRIGFVPSTPTEFNVLSHAIFLRTKTQISISSIKRLWGYVSYTGFPSKSTLNTLARFNDFKDWETFLQEYSLPKNGSDSSSFVDGSIINSSKLTVGDRVLLRWEEIKGCSLEYISYLRFRVIDAENIKLQKDDICVVSSICVGFPLFVSNIQRGQSIIPAYVGAKKGGISSIEYFPVEGEL